MARSPSARGTRLRHATPADLDALEGLLEQLRGVHGLVERKRGSFSRRSRAFLHFHAGADSFYADVRLGEAFERLPVTSADEQARFLGLVRDVVGSVAAG